MVNSLNQKGIALLGILILGVVGAFVFTKVLAQTPDTTPPSFPCCSKPDPMEVVTGNVNLEPNVYDESDIAKVEVRFRDPLDPINRQGTQYVFSDTQSPFQIPWDSTKLSDGRQRYDVYAWDIHGNGGSNYLSASLLAMNNPSYPPISVSPGAGTTVSGVVPIEISTSADNGIAGVYVYEQSSPGGSYDKKIASFNNSPYRFDWNAADYPDGLHSFRIRSFENDKFSNGDLGDPGEITFEVCVRSCTQQPSPTPTPTKTPSPSPSPTQSSYGTITGTIYSSTGKVVAGAKITLRVNNKNTTYTSDAQGTYIIPNLPPGTYLLTYVAAGYSQQKTTASVTAGQTLVLNATLKPK